MRKSDKVRPYFLLSFIPAVGYWLLETYTSLEIALIGGIVLGLLEMAVEKIFTGHVLVVILGFVSLYAREGLWFKLQPTFTGIAIGGFLLFKKLTGHSLILDMLKDMQQTPPLPEQAYKTMETHLTIFLFAFAAFMAKVAIYDSTSVWIFWKTGGFYVAFGAFLVVELIYLRSTLRPRS
jgi:intracellular septation protein